jgi:hypothetical protein
VLEAAAVAAVVLAEGTWNGMHEVVQACQQSEWDKHSSECVKIEHIMRLREPSDSNRNRKIKSWHRSDLGRESLHGCMAKYLASLTAQMASQRVICVHRYSWQKPQSKLICRDSN